jgi:hypothetical protein
VVRARLTACHSQLKKGLAAAPPAGDVWAVGGDATVPAGAAVEMAI